MTKQKHITIDIKDIASFCFCPMLYDIRHTKDYNKTLNDAYDESLHNTLYQCLRLLQDNKLKYSIDFLKMSWGKEWIKTKKGSELVLSASSKSRDCYNSLRITGIEAILKFDKYVLSEPQFPVVINTEYFIDIGDITVRGKWEYIREVDTDDGKKIQLIRFVTHSSQYYTNMQANNDIELISAGIAFKERFSNDVELIYIDIMSNKVISFTLTDEKINTFIKTVKSVADCLRHNIRCVSHDVKCYHCDNRQQCSTLYRKEATACLK